MSKAFERLYDWLESDRDRHKATFLGDYAEIWRVELWIDRGLVAAASGNELPEVVTEALRGMVVR